ncbi:MAG: neutral/alkaline non-lysosomal ceramidase N-terminal domain-containing protein [Acidobacteria bacterium]|nr:neutral/alkaline non-lysosomal ceramidase N-terminal domain-containing protein [Acidobacteriota bacterium]
MWQTSFSFFSRVLVLGLVLGIPGFAFPDGLRAGFATADLTPPLGVEMGGFGYNLGRTGDAVHDPILARAAVFELNGKRMAMVGCDLGGISLEVTEKVRREVEKETGIPGQRVMVGTTHSHSAPVVANWIGVGKPDAKYLSEVHLRIASAVIAASRKLQPVTVSYGQAAVEGVARNREYKDGPVDPYVRVLKFTGPSSELAGFIANYSVHSVVMSERTRLFTGDLTGVSVNMVMNDHPGAIGIFLQGSCGDINPVYAHMPQDESLQKLEMLANLLAGDIRVALEKASAVEVHAIHMDARRIALPLEPPDKAMVMDRMQTAEGLLKYPDLPERLRRELEYRRDSARAVLERFHRPPLTEKVSEVQVGLLGDVVIAANPGETFLVFGQKTAELIKHYKVIVTGYTNDYVGYIPSADRYVVDEQKGLSYPAYLTPWINGEFRFREDVGDVLVAEMVKLAGDVTRAGRSSN